ncbi:MAG: phosphonate ABC transporter, permease protein PhnE [Acidimicrobiia bacterium]|nr:phosphonate ABC transporter, permease protein PhnE [Acidimicrobiia bacterium]
MNLDLRDGPGTELGQKIGMPMSRDRLIVRLFWLALLLLVPPALIISDVVPATFIAGLGDLWNLFNRMWPPDIYEPARLLRLLWETFLIAVAGTFIAVVLSIPLAFLAARNTTPAPWISGASRAVITVTRAIPDLIFAIILVRVLGLGPLPGALALGLHSIGMLGKLFSDAIEETDPSPIEATYSLGASKLQAIATSVFPQVLPQFIGTSLYRLDINLRMSPVLGFVGAGGIGFELQGTLRQIRYDRGLTVIVMILLLIVIVERASSAIRQSILTGGGNGAAAAGLPGWVSSMLYRRESDAGAREELPDEPDIDVGTSGKRRRSIRIPWTRRRFGNTAAAVGLITLVVASFFSLNIDMADAWRRLPEFFDMLASMWPPDFSDPGSWMSATFESIMIAVAGTFLGVIITLPFAFFGAKNVTGSRVLYNSARYGVVLVRGVPELIMAVIFVAAVGLGPFAGVMALAIGTIGLSGKLIMDSIEGASPPPLEAITSAGGTRTQVASVGITPQVVPSMIGVILYQLDINIRASVILGIVGAGGVGFILLNSIRALHYQRALAMLIVIFLVVYAIERLATWIRGYFI